MLWLEIECSFLLSIICCRASEFVFYSKPLIEGFLCDSHHCQATLVGKSESYNELYRDSTSSKFCRAFVSRNAAKLEFMEDDSVMDEEEDALNACPQFGKTFYWESSQKSLSTAVWMWLSILEAKERNLLETYKFGPKIEDGKRVSFRQSRDDFMIHVDKLR